MDNPTFYLKELYESVEAILVDDMEFDTDTDLGETVRLNINGMPEESCPVFRWDEMVRVAPELSLGFLYDVTGEERAIDFSPGGLVGFLKRKASQNE